MKVLGAEEDTLAIQGERFLGKRQLISTIDAPIEDELASGSGSGSSGDGSASSDIADDSASASAADADASSASAAAAPAALPHEEDEEEEEEEEEEEDASLPPQQQVARVCEGLLLSSAAALRVERLRALRVTRVLSAAPELPDTPRPPGVALERVALHDHPAADLLRHLDAVADAVHQEQQRGGTTLIHCVAGVSRSAALCLAYLVKHLRMPLRKAFAHLRARRPCVRPNAGFFRQLIEFERRHLGAVSVAMVQHPCGGAGLPRLGAAKALCIPDVYEPEYRATLWLQRHYPCSMGRH